MPKVTIKAHGALAERVPAPFTFEAMTAVEAIKAFTAQFLKRSLGQPTYELRVPGFETVEDLCKPLVDDVTLDLVPAFDGEKSGLTQVLIGAAFIAVAAWNPAGALTAPLLGSSLT